MLTAVWLASELASEALRCCELAPCHVEGQRARHFAMPTLHVTGARAAAGIRNRAAGDDEEGGEAPGGDSAGSDRVRGGGGRGGGGRRGGNGLSKRHSQLAGGPSPIAPGAGASPGITLSVSSSGVGMQ
jgi:uncharacterized membrane protein YgcG